MEKVLPPSLRTEGEVIRCFNLPGLLPASFLAVAMTDLLTFWTASYENPTFQVD
jgi:hypothetical protein